MPPGRRRDRFFDELLNFCTIAVLVFAQDRGQFLFPEVDKTTPIEEAAAHHEVWSLCGRELHHHSGHRASCMAYEVQAGGISFQNDNTNKEQSRLLVLMSRSYIVYSFHRKCTQCCRV